MRYLTPREIQIIERLHLANVEIAKELGLAVSTIENHMRSILSKTRCANRTEIAVKYLKGELEGVRR